MDLDAIQARRIDCFGTYASPAARSVPLLSLS